MKINSIFTALLTSLTLVACGGGGGTAPAAVDVTDKYLGSWTICTADQTNANASIKTIFDFKKINVSSISFTLVDDSYSNSTCSGTAIPGSDYGAGVANFAGTKLVGNETVDKIDFMLATPEVKAVKDIGFYNGSGLKFGNDALVDSNGYPTALDPNTATKTDTTSLNVTNKYLGIWTGCNIQKAPNGASLGKSDKETYTFTKSTSTTVSYENKKSTYPNETCLGTPENAAPLVTNGVLTVIGTRSVTGRLLDKLNTVTALNPTVFDKRLATILSNGQSLNLIDGGALDANGYPEAALNFYQYTKQ